MGKIKQGILRGALLKYYFQIQKNYEKQVPKI